MLRAAQQYFCMLRNRGQKFATGFTSLLPYLSIFYLSACEQKLLSGEFNALPPPEGGASYLDEKGGKTALSSGKMSGSAVEIPKNAVRKGARLSIWNTTIPKEFVILRQTIASDPVEVKGVDEKGEQLENTLLPAIITLKIYPQEGVTNLASTPKKKENLCVLINSVAKRTFVYYFQDIELKGDLASIKTKRLGVFQAAYCNRDAFSQSDRDDLTSPTPPPVVRLEPPPPTGPHGRICNRS